MPDQNYKAYEARRYFYGFLNKESRGTIPDTEPGDWEIGVTSGIVDVCRRRDWQQYNYSHYEGELEDWLERGCEAFDIS